MMQREDKQRVVLTIVAVAIAFAMFMTSPKARADDSIIEDHSDKIGQTWCNAETLADPFDEDKWCGKVLDYKSNHFKYLWIEGHREREKSMRVTRFFETFSVRVD